MLTICVTWAPNFAQLFTGSSKRVIFQGLAGAIGWLLPRPSVKMMWSASSGASTGMRRLLPDPVHSILSAPMAKSCDLYQLLPTKKVVLMGGPCDTNCQHNYEMVCTHPHVKVETAIYAKAIWKCCRLARIQCQLLTAVSTSGLHFGGKMDNYA